MGRTASRLALLLLCSALLLGTAPARAATQSVSAALDLSSLALGDVAHPAVAFDGTRYLLVWEEGPDVWGARLDRSGAVLPPGRFRLALAGDPVPAPARTAPAVAAAPWGFLVVWSESTDGGVSWAVRGARVDATGGVTSSVDVSAGPAAYAPAVARSGGELLVAYEDRSAATPGIFAARVDATTVGALPRLSGATGDPRNPAVAANANGYLVAWDETAADGKGDVHAVSIGLSGLVGPGLAIAASTADERRPAAAANVDGFLVAWSDDAAGTFDVLAARVRPADPTPVLDPAGLLVAQQVGADMPLAVASDGDGYLVAFERSDVTVSAHGARVWSGGTVGADFSIEPQALAAPGQTVTFGDGAAYLTVHRVLPGGAPRLGARLVTTAFRLDVATTGTGSGTVRSTPAIIDCGATCAALFDAGSTVTLDAVAAAGSHLAAWTGCPLAVGAACTVTMDAATSVGASFALDAPGQAGVPTYGAIGTGSVTVTWTAAATATGYELQRAPDQAGSPGTFATIATLSGTSHVDGTLGPNTTYWFQVRGTNADGTGSWSSATSVTTLPGAPGAPTCSSVTATSVAVSWTAPAGGAAAYELERNDGTTWSAVAIVSGTSHADSALTAATTYQYRVRARNVTGSSGAGAWSPSTPVTTLPLAPAAPGSPSYSEVGSTSVRLSWSGVAGATSYDVERGLSADGPWGPSGTDIAGTTHVDGTLSPSTTYWYRVTASNAGGAGTPSAPSSVTTGPGAPGAPTFSSVLATSVTLSWTAPASGASGYVVERATGAGTDWAPVATLGATLTWTDATVAPSTTYQYRVRGTNASATGDASPAAPVTTLPLPPAAPAAPTCGPVGETSATVSWTGVSGATSYDLERASAALGPFTPVASDLTATTHVDSPLSANTAYWYRVRGSNTGGDGPFSPTCSALTRPAAPGAPTFSNLGATSVTVSWAAPAGGAATYTVERATGAGAWTAIATGLATTTLPDPALSANVTYRYRVRAANASGDGAYSAEGSVTTLAGAPGTPTFSAVTATTLVVSWTAPASGAVSYDVQRATSAAGPFATVAPGVTGLSVPDSGLSPGSTYFYRVVAVTTAGPGSPSSVAQILMQPGAPGAPTFTNLGSASVTVSWTPAAGAASYKVERAPDTGANAPGTWLELTAGLTTTTYASTGLAANAKYWYRLRATNTSGDGAYSAASSITTLPGAPGTPAFSGATTTSLTVSWTAPAGGASSYELERAPSATGTFVNVATVTAPTATDVALTVGSTYWYRVRAVTPAGAGAYSAAAQGWTLPGAPGPITFSNIVATSLRLTWTAAAGAASYKIERAPDNGANAPGTWAQLQAGVTATSYDSAGLTANVKYWYRVRATNPSGDGAYSAPASVTTLPNPPGAPTFSSVTTVSLTVSWTAPSGGAASYDLERGTSATGPWTTLATGTNSLSYADSGLTPGTTYWYQVRATNLDGLKSAYASRSVLTLPAAPAGPTFTSVGAFSLTVDWTLVTSATTYRLERAPDAAGVAGAWAEIAVISTAPYSPYADSQLSPNTRYWYRLRAANASGNGAYSPERSVMTLPGTPGTPTFSSGTKTSVTVSWTAPAGGASTYELQRAPSANGPWTTVAPSAAALSYTDATLAAGTTYYYRVRAANADGGFGAWSAVASASTVPEAPGAPWFTGVSTVSLTVNWNPVPGALTYRVERAPDASGQPGAWTEIAILTDTYYNDVGAPNTISWYRVRAANDGGYGDYSPASSVRTVTSAPGTPTFSNVTMTSVTVSWTAPPDGDGTVSYELERATSFTGPFARVATPTARTYTDATLSAGTAYWYRVRAKNAAGLPGAYSGARSVTTLAAPPGGPTYPSVTAASVTLAWAPAEGATRYQVERSSGSSGAWTQLTSSVTGTSFTDSTVAANATYSFRVSALNSAGAPGPYSAATPVTTAPAAPGAPTFGSISAASLVVSWTAPAGGASSYTVERGASSAGPFTAIATGLPALSHADSGLAASTTYWYRVRAANAAGLAGAASAARSVATAVDATAPPSAAPGAPTFTSVAATSLRVSWMAAANVTTYRLERALAPAGSWLQLAALPGTGYTDTGLSANTTYRYRVRGSNAAGDGPVSPESSVTTAPGAPGAPAFTATAATSVTVTWTAPAGGAASYRLERATSALGPWLEIATGIAGTSRVDSGLTGNTTYHYRVRATNASGTNGAYSPAASVTTPASGGVALPGAPGAPTFTNVLATSLRVSWTAANGATSYTLERAAAAAGPWTAIAAVGSPGFTDTGRTANTPYWYRVRGSNGGGTGPYSPAAAIVTAPNAPGTPTFTSVAIASLTVGWSAPAGGAASYRVERATSASGPWTEIAAGVTVLAFADSGLAGNTTYLYRVRATSAGGTSGGYSANAFVTTGADGATPLPTAPEAPVFTNVTSSSLRVLWGAASGATTYDVERVTGGAAPSATWTVVATGLSVASYLDTGVAANARYGYRIRGVNAGGRGDPSPPSDVVTAPGVPGVPAFSAIGATTLTVSWTPPTGGAASYKLERAIGSSGPWGLVAPGIPTTTWSESGLLPGTMYFYRVRATNSAGLDGTVSAMRSTTTAADASTPIAGAPGTPIATDIRATALKLSWTAGTAATSYAVERASAAAGPWAQVASVAATTYGDTGLTANTAYWYRIRGVNARGDGLASEATTVVTAPNAPGAPTFTNIGATSVTVSWTVPAGGAARYALERAATATGTWGVVASGLATPTYTESGLAAGATWYYRVQARNADGTPGAYSAPRSVVLATGPGI